MNKTIKEQCDARKVVLKRLFLVSKKMVRPTRAFLVDYRWRRMIMIRAKARARRFAAFLLMFLFSVHAKRSAQAR